MPLTPIAPTPDDLAASTAARTFPPEIVDVGDQAQPNSVALRCWVCDHHLGVTSIGLCRECDDEVMP